MKMLDLDESVRQDIAPSSLNEIKKGAKDSNGFTKCWPGKHAEGTKKGKNGKPVRNCVPNESVAEGRRYGRRHKCGQCCNWTSIQEQAS
jgi:hypothetical protein